MNTLCMQITLWCWLFVISTPVLPCILADAGSVVTCNELITGVNSESVNFSKFCPYSNSVPSTFERAEKQTWLVLIAGLECEAQKRGFPEIENEHRLKIIEGLLELQGDLRISGNKLSHIYSLRSTTPKGSHSVQVEALFLINFLLERDDDPTVEVSHYAQIPEVHDLSKHSSSSMGGPIINEAFVIYRKWFELLRKYVKEGKGSIYDFKVKPFDNSNLTWG